RKTERWILRSVDGRLDAARGRELEEHLASCPACARAAAEYREMFGLLRNRASEEPLPRFWERLQPGLAGEKRSFSLVIWERWCLRAIPAFLGLAAVLGAGLVLFAPPARTPLTQAELLFRDQNPVTEAGSIFEEGRGESRHMELLFAATDERELRRRTP
ncbi:MAG TPA: zf-HC2 domain-containing protein, partial [Acidobacteriota bacterium]|nr:zf-HC2 domain-containing protein [Acidobacteriota bacterium]